MSGTVAAHPLDLEPAAEAASSWSGTGAACRRGGGRSPRPRGSARARAARARRPTSSGTAGGDLVEPAGIHPHLVAAPCGSGPARRRASTRAPPRPARPAPRPTLSALPASIGSTGRKSCTAKRASPAAPSVSAARATGGRSPAQHDGAADVGRRDAGRARHRLDHQRLERALAQLAHHEAERGTAARPRRAVRAARAGAAAARPAEPLPVVRAMRSSAASTSVSSTPAAERSDRASPALAAPNSVSGSSGSGIAPGSATASDAACSAGPAEAELLLPDDAARGRRRRARSHRGARPANSSASSAILSRRLRVAATRREVSTRAASFRARSAEGGAGRRAGRAPDGGISSPAESGERDPVLLGLRIIADPVAVRVVTGRPFAEPIPTMPSDARARPDIPVGLAEAAPAGAAPALVANRLSRRVIADAPPSAGRRSACLARIVE